MPIEIKMPNRNLGKAVFSSPLMPAILAFSFALFARLIGSGSLSIDILGTSLLFASAFGVFGYLCGLIGSVLVGLPATWVFNKFTTGNPGYFFATGFLTGGIVFKLTTYLLALFISLPKIPFFGPMIDFNDPGLYIFMGIFGGFQALLYWRLMSEDGEFYAD